MQGRSHESDSYSDEIDDTLVEDELSNYISDDERDPLQDFECPPLKIDYSTAVIVSNIPEASAEKIEKLKSIMKKLLIQCGDLQEDGFYMPFNEETNKNHGFMFANFMSADSANKALSNLNGHVLDKKHILSVRSYEILEHLSHVPSEYIPPKPLENSARRDLHSWLIDDANRDQFVIRYSFPVQSSRHIHETMVYWCERLAPPALCYGGEREKDTGKTWVELSVSWSPKGTYLATLHQQGVALWGGKSFEKQGRYAHFNIKEISFSPCENYLLTFNDDGSEQSIIIWDLRTSEQLRTFPSIMEDGSPFGKFKWSYDGKYIGRVGEKKKKKALYIYTVPTLQLLDKKSVKADAIEDFEWSPTASLLGYWAPEEDNSPARVSLVEIPSRKDIRQKNLFKVRECQLQWQSDGRYLAVKVLRYTKTKKGVYSNFEFFRVLDPQIPVEMLEISDNVISFAWEPSGDRFALVHGSELQRSKVTFYTMKGGSDKNRLTEIQTIVDKPIDTISWSTQGQFIVMGAMGESSGPNNGYLCFYDLDNKTILKETEHFRMNYLAWDPAGHYVATAVNQPLDSFQFKAQMDNGFKLWTFQGEEFFNMTKDHFYQILWRPRPPSVLSADDKKKIIKNLKRYEREFEEADKIASRREARIAMADKVRQKKAFRKHISILWQRIESRHRELVQLRNGYDSNDESYFSIEKRTREVVQSVHTEIL